MIDVKALTESVIRQVHAYVSPALQTVQRQVVELGTKFDQLPVPKDGKDADPAVIKAMVAEAISAIPPAKDGQSVTLSDVAPLVDEAVSKRVAELPVPKDGERGADGKDGKDADEAAIAQAISEGIEKALPAAVQKALDGILPSIVEKVVAAIPVPRDGVDGKSPDEAQILASVTEKMLRAVEALPKPNDGRDGRDAPEVDLDAVVMKVLPLIPKPKDGTDGRDAEPVDVDAVVAKAMELIPTPKDGIDGKDGRDGIDGKSVTLDDLLPALEAKAAGWQLEFERRAGDVLRGAIDKMPAPLNGQDGRDGKDGFSPDNVDVSLDGRVFKFVFTCGERVVTKEIKVPFPLDRGTYRSGADYEKGDVVTYGGSQWIAQKDTKDAPPSDAWRLCVKKGKDGKGS